MRKLILVLVLSAVLLGLSPVLIRLARSTITGVAPPASGTWTINANTEVTDEDLIINGSIMVNPGYELKLVRSTLRMNLPSSDGQYGIYVQGAGQINMTDSRILNYTNNCYYFNFHGWAYFDGFEISGVGWDDADIQNQTLYIYTSNNILKNGVLHHGKAAGFYILQNTNYFENVTVHDISQVAYKGLGFWLGSYAITNDNVFVDIHGWNMWFGFNEQGKRNTLAGAEFYNCTGYTIASLGEYFTATDLLLHDSNDGFKFYGTSGAARGQHGRASNLTVYNILENGLNINSWCYNVSFTDVVMWDSSILLGTGIAGLEAGAKPYNYSLVNAWANHTGYYGPDHGVGFMDQYGGINLCENSSQVLIDNVEVQNSRYGIWFSGDSLPMGYFDDVVVRNSNFHNRGNESDVWVQADATVSNVRFVNTYYKNQSFDGVGSFTSTWNTSTTTKSTTMTHSLTQNRKVGMTSWAYTANSTVKTITFTESAVWLSTGVTLTNCTSDNVPSMVFGGATWAYNSATKILTLTKVHSTVLATIQIVWYSYTPTTVIGTNNMTYYFRSDSWTVNEVSAYRLDDSETSALSTLTSQTASQVAVSVGFRLYLVHASGSSTEVTGGTTILASFIANYSGDKICSWLAPKTSMVLGFDALEVILYTKLGEAAWEAKASYITEVPIFSRQILNQTWTFHLYLTVLIHSYSTSITYSFGDSTHQSRITSVGLKTPLVQEIQTYYLQKGDLVQWLLYGYTAIIGQAVFFGLMLLAFCGTTYVRYRSFSSILMAFILFGGTGGLIWAFVPAPAVFVAWVFLLVGLAVLIFRVIR